MATGGELATRSTKASSPASVICLDLAGHNYLFDSFNKKAIYIRCLIKSNLIQFISDLT